MKNYQIHRVGSVIIKHKKLLVTRDDDEDYFKSPGGRIESSEKPEQTIIRELAEELGIEVNPDNMELFGTYFVEAHDGSGKKVRMDTYLVRKWKGTPEPQAEIAELKWITSDGLKTESLGKVFRSFVIPDLKKKGLIV